MAASQSSTGVRVLGARRLTLRDAYHVFLRAPWPAALGAIVVGWLAINAGFAGLYLLTGGITGARFRSFVDAFFFSVQTMGTIGYGSMYPTSLLANVVMTAESVTSLVVTALATGLVFAKFSRATARVVFAHQATIGPMNGVPTLMLRIGNERGNSILEATIRVAIIRTEHQTEGKIFYRMLDLKLSRERSPAMARSWTVLHPITPDSPLHGESPESLAEGEVELAVNLVGTDDTSLQPVHARARYEHTDILWGARHVDILSETPDGTLVLDIRRFHDVEPTRPIEGFPYPRSPAASGAARSPGA